MALRAVTCVHCRSEGLARRSCDVFVSSAQGLYWNVRIRVQFGEIGL